MKYAILGGSLILGGFLLAQLIPHPSCEAVTAETRNTLKQFLVSQARLELGSARYLRMICGQVKDHAACLSVADIREANAKNLYQLASKVEVK
jgi:hypothetical protein